MSGPEIVVPVGFSPIDPLIIVTSTRLWVRRFARARMLRREAGVLGAHSPTQPR